jgi:flagellar biogenesis protein FliO
MNLSYTHAPPVKIPPFQRGTPLALSTIRDYPRIAAVKNKTARWRKIGDGTVKRLIIAALTLAWILVAANPAFSAATLTGLKKLEGITVTEHDGGIDTVFKFAEEYKGEFTPSFYQKSIQIDLPNAYTSPSKREFRAGAGSAINAMAAQVSANKVRTRLFVPGDPRAFSSAWKVRRDGSTVTLTLEKNASVNAASAKVNTPEKAAAKPVAVEPAQSAVSAKPFDKDAMELLGKMEKESADSPIRAVEPAPKAKDEPAPAQGAPRKNFGFLAQPVYAAEAPKAAEPEKAQGKKLITYEEPKAPEAPSLTAMAAKMMGALALVVGLVLALAWVAQKYMGKFNTAFGSSGVVKVLTTSSIGVKKQISVVDVAGEIIVLGISGDSITMLTTIDNMESADRLRRASNGGDKGVLPKNLTEYMKNMGGPEKGGGLLKKIAASLKAKGDKGFSAIPPALMDEDNPLTFAGNLKAADSEPLEAPFKRPNGKVETKDMGPSSSREELMRKVTGAIRAKNGNLGIA